jgi:lipoic acid synthetase
MAGQFHDQRVLVNVVTAYRLGTVEYNESWRLQEDLAMARASGAIGDTLLMLQHPPVITIGQDGGQEDILATATELRRMGISVIPTDRGGRATYHGPGQLVVYPILKPPNGDLHAYVWRLEETAIRVLDSYRLRAGRMDGHPGVWMGSLDGAARRLHGRRRGKKIAAVGLAVQDGIARHGLALNVAPEMAHFDLLIPCGNTDCGVTSMACELGWSPALSEVTDRFERTFGQVFSCQVEQGVIEAGSVTRLLGQSILESAQPTWLWQRISPQAEDAVNRMGDLLDRLGLHTVCQEAHCPNIAECFGQGTATFMILGNSCSRGCRFCAVKRGEPAALDPGEPERVADAAFRLNLQHVVITSVTRDDLPDGGARHFAATVQAIRRRSPGAVIEVLIPDFAGSQRALEALLAAEPDVVNHNLETVSRLYPRVRPGADYRRSLGLLAWTKARAPRMVTKSGLMLGLGESRTELVRTFYDLRQARCDLLTLGQYLQPTDAQLPVDRYVPPAEFASHQARAESLGFRGVAAGPLVRSSYWAEALWQQAISG